MVTSNSITPGMILSIEGELYQVDSSVKVTVKKGAPFIKTKLRELSSKRLKEKNFKLNQAVKSVPLVKRELEFLYPEGKNYLFMDIGSLDQVLVPGTVIGETINYLKEGTLLSASFYEDTVTAVELPQFLELMVAETDGDDDETPLANDTKQAVLETGAKLEVPPFVEVGDIIKVDTQANEYIQRV